MNFFAYRELMTQNLMAKSIGVVDRWRRRRCCLSGVVGLSGVATGGDRVSVQGVESLWGDCRFIPADWGS